MNFSAFTKWFIVVSETNIDKNGKFDASKSNLTIWNVIFEIFSNRVSQISAERINERLNDSEAQILAKSNQLKNFRTKFFWGMEVWLTPLFNSTSLLTTKIYDVTSGTDWGI